MNDERVKELLRDAMGVSRAELRRDLWPEMRDMIDSRRLRVTPLDWGLIAAAAASMAIFPEAALTLLYHF